MPWLIFALGLCLAVAGGWSVVHGYPYMQIEFGWTEVIAGSTALAGGIVTLALAAVLRSLMALRRAVERTRLTAALPREKAPKAAAGQDLNSALQPAPVPPLEASTGLPPTEAPPAQGAKPQRSRSPRVGEPVANKDSPKLQEPASARDPISNEDPPPKTVLGRYQSSGSSYSLFTDGTIEVESEAGRRRFGSMGELKTFLASEEAPALGGTGKP